jgi:selT/selW/selH-like putative selenoprotein
MEFEVAQPTFLNALIGQCLSYAFFIGLFLVFAGESVFESLQIPSAVRFCRLLKDNQLICLAILFSFNFLSNSLQSTGAFEVFIDGNLIHSKINSGLVPDANYLLSEIRKAAKRN